MDWLPEALPALPEANRGWIAAVRSKVGISRPVAASYSAWLDRKELLDWRPSAEANSAEGIRRKRPISSSSWAPKTADKPTGADAIRTVKAAPKWRMRKGRGPEAGGLRTDPVRYFRRRRRRRRRCFRYLDSTPIDGSTDPPDGGGAFSSSRNADAVRRYRPDLNCNSIPISKWSWFSQIKS